MKRKFLIAFMIFIITVSTSKGLKSLTPKKYSHTKNITCNNPIIVNGNRTYIQIEDRPNKPKRVPGPVVVRKKFRCICKLPFCECSKRDNPETWFVKTFVGAKTKMRPAEYSVKPYNLTEEIYKCLEELRKLEEDYEIKKKAENSFKWKLCPLKKKPQCGNKWLFSCLPLINPSKKKNWFQRVSPKRDLKIRTECLECKLQQSKEDKAKVLLKCKQCGPVYTNEKDEKINFSKLLLKRENKLMLNVKFIQVINKTN